MRPRISLVNPQGGNPVQLVCKTDTITKIFTEEVLDSSITESKDKAILTNSGEVKIWLNEKDNIIQKINVYMNPLATYIKPFKYPNNTLIKEFNTIPTYQNTSERSRKAVEARNTARLSKTSQIKIECSRGLNIAYKFGKALLGIQKSDYGLRVKKVKQKVNV